MGKQLHSRGRGGEGFFSDKRSRIGDEQIDDDDREVPVSLAMGKLPGSLWPPVVGPAQSIVPFFFFFTNTNPIYNQGIQVQIMIVLIIGNGIQMRIKN